MSASLGPWTTAIDSGPMVTLSAFWKRRIGQLPELARTSPRVSRRMVLLLAAAGMLALGWPTAQLTRHVVAADPQPQDAPKPAATPEAQNEQQSGKPLVIDLGDGVIAELLGMTEHPSKDKAWWSADGSPIEAPYQQFHSRANHPGYTLREIALRIKKPLRADVAPDWSIQGTSGFAGGIPEDAAGNRLRNIDAAAVALPPEQTTGLITFRVAAGPWTTVAGTDGEHYWSEGRMQHGYVYTPAVETSKGVNITISHNVLHRDLRIVAVDVGGNILANGGAHGGGASDFIQSTGTFANLKLEDVAFFQLQARPYHRFEVRNVALHPNQHTEPEIIDLGTDEDVIEDVKTKSR